MPSMLVDLNLTHTGFAQIIISIPGSRAHEQAQMTDSWSIKKLRVLAAWTKNLLLAHAQRALELSTEN